ncbi:hypothetical protein IM40_05550 [Candidatus Paracaedimonas acanthamoebae]|nr:hypothetical protein IM40_05550 [Candidatus Paracaedimonas acanthamoebae]
MIKVLITGASGFIGQALCSFLIEKGIRIKAALRSKQDTYPYEFSVIEDITKRIEWEQALDGVEIVIHLAAQVHGVKRVRYLTLQQDVFNIFDINVAGTKALVQASCNKGIKHFIYLSSIKVNGEITHSKPFIEKDILCPEDEYGQSKLQAEEAIKSYCKGTNMSYTILRPTLVYGPKVKGNFLDLLNISASKFPLPFAGIHNKRSLIYVENLLDIIYLTLLHPKAKNETFVLCDGQDLSIQELIIQIRKAMALSPHLWNCPLPVLEFIFKTLKREQAFLRLSSSLQVDDQKLRSYVGWQPRFSVEEGLEKTVQWFLSEKK